MDDQKPLDIWMISKEQVEIAGSMASADSLAEKNAITIEVVSPFGLLNNEEKIFEVYFDKDIVSEEIAAFHPNTNEKRSY